MAHLNSGARMVGFGETHNLPVSLEPIRRRRPCCCRYFVSRSLCLQSFSGIRDLLSFVKPSPRLSVTDLSPRQHTGPSPFASGSGRVRGITGLTRSGRGCWSSGQDYRRCHGGKAVRNSRPKPRVRAVSQQD